MKCSVGSIYIYMHNKWVGLINVTLILLTEQCLHVMIMLGIKTLFVHSLFAVSFLPYWFPVLRTCTSVLLSLSPINGFSPCNTSIHDAIGKRGVSPECRKPCTLTWVN